MPPLRLIRSSPSLNTSKYQYTNYFIGALVSAINHVPAGKFSPIVSGPGTILPDLPANLIRQGKFAHVDYVAGHCSNDGRTFTSGTPTTLVTEDQLIAAVLKRWPSLVGRLFFSSFVRKS